MRVSVSSAHNPSSGCWLNTTRFSFPNAFQSCVMVLYSTSVTSLSARLMTNENKDTNWVETKQETAAGGLVFKMENWKMQLSYSLEILHSLATSCTAYF